jgi:hypothetical protein
MAKAKRPVGATVIAVFNLLFGLPCICCAGIASGGSLFSAMDKGNDQNAFKIEDKDAAQNPFLKGMKQGMEEQEFVEKEVSHSNIANFVMYAIGTLASLLLFVSGILLLMMRNSGRWICILGAGLLLTSAAADMLYSTVFVYPAVQKYQDKQRREGKLAPDTTGPEISALGQPGAFLVLGGGYAILAIAVMLSGPTRDAFAAASGRRARDDDFDRPPDDYDAYDQRRDFDAR